MLLLFEELGERLEASQDVLDTTEQRRVKEEIEELFIAIGSIVGPQVLDKAFGYMSQITEHVARESRRTVFWVRGSKEEQIYRVLPVGFCTCKSFQEQRIGTSQPFCKHIVAVYLAKIQRTAVVQVHEDDEWGARAW